VALSLTVYSGHIGDGMDPPAFSSAEVAGRSLLPRIYLEGETSDEPLSDNWHRHGEAHFLLHGENAAGKGVLRRKLTRESLIPFLANQPCSTIAMGAGCGAHNWARAFLKPGHEVRLIHPKFVKRLVKTNKNDWNDATAICEAAQRSSPLISERTALCCQIRGLLAEYGTVLPVTVAQLRRGLPRVLEDAENGLTVRGRELIASLRDEL
jgi:transposase